MTTSCVRRLCSTRFSTRLVKNASSTAFCRPRLPVYPRLDNLARHNRFVISKRSYCSASQGSEPDSGFLYTKEHEWASADRTEPVPVGISNYAQEKLGDVVFVELPEIGQEFSKGDVAVVIESVKAAADVHTPISGEVVVINERLVSDPDLVNKDPYNTGWLFKLKDVAPEDFDNLMDAEKYNAFLEESND